MDFSSYSIYLSQRTNTYPSMNDKSIQICNWYNQPGVLIFVHGHCQCSVCEINIDECCRGGRIDDKFIGPVKTSGEDFESERN